MSEHSINGNEGVTNTREITEGFATSAPLSDSGRKIRSAGFFNMNHLADEGAAKPSLGSSRLLSPLQLWTRFERRFQSQKWVTDRTQRESLPVEKQNLERVEGRRFVDTSSGEIYDVDRFLKLPRIARCSWSIGGNVEINSAPSGSHYTSVERCGSISSCPCCAPLIRQGRAEEIKQAVNAHLENPAHSILFLTLTLRHDAKDELSLTLDTVMEGWRQLIKGKWWTHKENGLKARYDITGYIRATEVTYGLANGWHPHAHILLFLDRALSDVELNTLGEEFHSKWGAYAFKRTQKMPTRDRGIDLQPVDTDGQVMGRYLSKIEAEPKKWHVGAEMARGDVKEGKVERFQPFQLLDNTLSLPESLRYKLWNEYTQAMYGRRLITWSRGLKKRYGIGERDDEELLEDCVTGSQIWSTPASRYRLLKKKSPLLLADALMLANSGDFTALAELLPPSAEYASEAFQDSDGHYKARRLEDKDEFEAHKEKMHIEKINSYVKNAKLLRQIVKIQ